MPTEEIPLRHADFGVRLGARPRRRQAALWAGHGGPGRRRGGPKSVGAFVERQARFTDAGRIASDGGTAPTFRMSAKRILLYGPAPMPEPNEHPYEAMSREELIREIERVRWLLDANPQVPWSADAEGNVTDFSQRWLDLTGLTREQAVNGGSVQASHPDDLPRVAEATVESRRLAATADALPALVFHADRELRYRFVNRRFVETFGRPEAEILGRTIRDVVGEATYAAVLPHLERALAGERAEWAMWVDFPTGRRFARATYVPSLGSDGTVAGIDVLAVDETEARRTEEALRETTRALQESERR